MHIGKLAVKAETGPMISFQPPSGHGTVATVAYFAPWKYGAALALSIAQIYVAWK